MKRIRTTTFAIISIFLLVQCGPDKGQKTGQDTKSKTEKNKSAQGQHLSELAGKWRAVDVQFYGIDDTDKEKQIEAYKEFIINTIVHYRPDGTMMVIFKNGMEEEGTWRVEDGAQTLVEKLDKAKKEDVSEIRTLNDSQLVLHSDAQKASMTFMRECKK